MALDLTNELQRKSLADALRRWFADRGVAVELFDARVTEEYGGPRRIKLMLDLGIMLGDAEGLAAAKVIAKDAVQPEPEYQEDVEIEEVPPLPSRFAALLTRKRRSAPQPKPVTGVEGDTFADTAEAPCYCIAKMVNIDAKCPRHDGA